MRSANDHGHAVLAEVDLKEILPRSPSLKEMVENHHYWLRLANFRLQSVVSFPWRFVAH